MESIWSRTAEMPKRKALSKDIQTNTAVIGGGLAGILTAYFLNNLGIKTVVLEASSVGSGQTKNTTAKITSQHGLIYDYLTEHFSQDKALQYARANQNAIEEYQRIIEKERISCHFERLPAYLYSTSEEKPLIKEAQAAKSLGIDASFTTRTSLPFEVKGAVKFNHQAQFHPLEFLKAISEGLEIYEDTRVKEVKGNEIFTDGGRVRADKIVFACHYPFVNLPGLYFIKMHQERSYVIALSGAAKLDGTYLGIDSDGLSFRNYEDLLLLGGGNHRTGENRVGGQYDTLCRAAKELYKNSAETARWSAQDCMTPDYLPYIGQFSSTMPDWYIATGFKKWGMTSSMVSAVLISDAIAGIKNPNAELFSPLRAASAPLAKGILQEGKQAVKGLSKRIFAPPREYTENLPEGHGGVVEYEGHKAGVYKDENGQVFAVSVQCPHLGCQLEWNPDEKSWDCPCHGSRFDYKGNLIDNPAQEDIRI